MRFIINGMKYDTDKMEKIAKVKKWYATSNALIRGIYGDVGSEYICELWKSSKGNWLLTHDYFTGAYENIDYVECSCCHMGSLEEGNYCPNCGAEMSEVEE